MLPQLGPKPMVALLSMVLLYAAACLPLEVKAESDGRLDPNTMEARVAACVSCHGSNGRAGPDGFYPRIAGKPSGYLLAQLLSFRDGGRNYEPMRHLLVGLPDRYLSEIAQYFADMHFPYALPASTNAPGALLEKGRILAESGDSSRGLPACASCHGSSFSGMAPGIPGLLGLPRDYILSQLGSWRNGLRRAAQPDCMANIAHQLTPEDMAAVSTWLASQAVPEPYIPAPSGSFSLPIQCGSTSPSTGGNP